MVEEYLSISQLNRFIKDVLNAGFPQPVWICGEIQGYDRNKDKKHVFFDLVEKDAGTSDIVAKIGVVIFAQSKSAIDNILKQSENAFSLKDDIEVKFSCRVDFYGPHGAVRLIVESIDPIYTLGKLAQERQKLIKALKENGTLDKNKLLPLPDVALNIGLITSYDSAAFNDFLSELQKSGFGFRLFVRNTLMQGKKTESDVVKAMDELVKIKTLDVVVITRGGGSIADLSFFDSKIIAEKIAAYRLPVLSGIGHEINTTVTDLAAHTFAKTPTAIAQFLVERVGDFLVRLDQRWDELEEASFATIEINKQALKNLALDLREKSRQFFKEHVEHMLRFQEILKAKPPFLVKVASRDLSSMVLSLKKGITSRLDDTKKCMANYEKMVELVHPANTLKRGFTITRKKGAKIIKSARDVAEGDELSTEFFDGNITSEVKIIKTRKA